MKPKTTHHVAAVATTFIALGSATPPPPEAPTPEPEITEPVEEADPKHIHEEETIVDTSAPRASAGATVGPGSIVDFSMHATGRASVGATRK